MAAIGGRYPTVIKADGLAAGKGVIIAASESEAAEALHALLVERRFGTEQVVVEEFLDGEELSLLALCDGETALPLASAQDYKRIFDGDLGPNTGGMGSYSPVPAVDAAEAAAMCSSVHQPVLDELRRRGIEFHGVLYAGLMMTADGPKVLEFNVRFGDPETQAILPRLRTDLLGLFDAAVVPGGLSGVTLEWAPDFAVTVVAREPRVSGELVVRRRDHRVGRRSGRRVRDPRRHGVRCRRRDRHRRRPSAECHGARLGCRGRPRRCLCCRGHDRLRR